MVASSGPLGSTIDAVTRALGTARDARRFLDALAEQLGARALVDVTDGSRTLAVRDGAHPALLAWPPLATLELAGGRCTLRVGGGDHLELAYDAAGGLAGARPGASRRLGPFERAASTAEVTDAAALAALVARGVDAHLAPLRLRTVNPTTAEALEIAAAAVPALRAELFQPSTREGAGVAITTVTDGWVGVTSTVDDAVAALDPAAVAAVVAFGPLPTRIPGRFWEAGYHRWARILGDAGDVTHALLRERDQVVTMIGELVVDRVDPWRLDAELDAADRDTRGVLAAIPDARPTPESSIVTSYRVVDDGHRRRVPTELAMSQAAPGLPPWQLPSPDDMPWQVARWRRASRR